MIEPVTETDASRGSKINYRFYPMPISSKPLSCNLAAANWEVKMMANDSPLTIVSQFIDYVNAGDIDKLNSYISQDIVFTDIQGRMYSEPEFMENYLRIYPNYRIHIKHLLQGGEGVAIIGSTLGSHVSPEVEENEVLVWTADVKSQLITSWRIYSTEGYAS